MTHEGTRTATCSCGQFKVTLLGDPAFVNMCNCYDCQVRSGSAFQLAAFFRDEQLVRDDGDRTTYARPTDTGRLINLQFCPTCGVSVVFRPEMRPGMVGVHGGCFADRTFPVPTRILYADRAHPWVSLPEAEIIPHA